MQSVINRMEQYLMYQKAFLFEDSDIAAQILDTKAKYPDYRNRSVARLKDYEEEDGKRNPGRIL